PPATPAPADTAPPTPIAPLPAPPPERSLAPLAWAAAGLALLALAGILAFRAAARSRRAPAADRAGPHLLDTRHAAADDEPRTVLARMDVANERVAKTVHLRERPLLVVTKGARPGHRYPLSSASALSLGRARANDVVIDDEAVSAQHCRIRPEGGQW